MPAKVTFSPPKEIKHLKKKAWLRAFAKCGAVQRACDIVKISYTTPYEWRKTDPLFAAGFLQAREAYTEWLEARADEMATAAKNPNATMMIFRLKGLRPNVYRERHEVRISDERMKEEAERIVALVRGRQYLTESSTNGNGHAESNGHVTDDS